MATTKAWSIKSNLGKVVEYSKNGKKTKNMEYDLKKNLDYATNKDKTEMQYFVTGINCEWEDAYQEMQDVKRLYRKEDGILGFHGYQSFAEGEVTPELAHEIGVKLAEELWGDRFQVVVTTHLNTNHIHNHFVVNSVSFKDGKKFYSCRASYGYMRVKSDELCERYGLSVLPNVINKYTKINYENYSKKYEQTNNYSIMAKRDLDFAIRQAFSYRDFFIIMHKMGYDIHERAGKISIRYKKYKRNIRIERRYGEDYTIENINRRILEENDIRIPFIEKYNSSFRHTPVIRKSKTHYKVKGFMAIYFHYMYLLNLYPRKIKTHKKLSPEMRAEIRKMETFSNEAKLLATNNINTDVELNNKINSIYEEIEKLEKDRDVLWDTRKSKKSEEEKKVVAHKISKVTQDISNLRKELCLYEDIKSRVPEMKENLKTQKKYEEEVTKEEQEKNIRKEKLRKYEY